MQVPRVMVQEVVKQVPKITVQEVIKQVAAPAPVVMSAAPTVVETIGAPMVETIAPSVYGGGVMGAPIYGGSGVYGGGVMGTQVVGGGAFGSPGFETVAPAYGGGMIGGGAYGAGVYGGSAVSNLSASPIAPFAPTMRSLTCKVISPG